VLIAQPESRPFDGGMSSCDASDTSRSETSLQRCFDLDFGLGPVACSSLLESDARGVDAMLVVLICRRCIGTAVFARELDLEATKLDKRACEGCIYLAS
jgi:hypothetical protein